MIGIVFQFATDVVEVRIDKQNISFRTSAFGMYFYPIEALHLSKEGVMKEFPDLKDMGHWKEAAIERFQSKIRGLRNEEEVSEYIIEDLTKFGYVPLYKQKAGHRVEKIQWQHG